MVGLWTIRVKSSGVYSIGAIVIIIVIINTQTGNEAGVWMTSCPEEMGWEFENFKNHVSSVPIMVLRSWVPTMVLRRWVPTRQLRVDIGPCRQTIESLPLVHRELSSLSSRHVDGVLQISTDRDLKHYKMLCAFVGSDSTVSVVRIVSHLVSKNRSQKWINGSYLNNRVASVFESRLYLYYGNTTHTHAMIICTITQV